MDSEVGDSEVSNHRFPRSLWGSLAVASVILMLNIPVAFLVGSYMGGLWLFATGSIRGIFTDLLFIEGIVALCIAGINIGGISESAGAGIGGARPGITSDRARRDPMARKRLRKEQLSGAMHLLVIGPILIGVALLVAFLPL
jgi:hypothetical protein